MHTVIDMSCEARSGAGRQQVLRLRLCFAFAKHNLHLIA
jgi:hypothetical protein